MNRVMKFGRQQGAKPLTPARHSLFATGPFSSNYKQKRKERRKETWISRFEHRHTLPSMPRATRESSDEEMEDASQPAATSGVNGKGKGRQPTVEEDELDEEDSDEEIEGSQGDAEDLRYDPDQKLEEKRRVRAQYRELLGQQDGARAFLLSFLS